MSCTISPTIRVAVSSTKIQKSSAFKANIQPPNFHFSRLNALHPTLPTARRSFISAAHRHRLAPVLSQATDMSASQPPQTKVLFVCLGNICRSPSAEAVFRAVVERAGAADRISIDSCGTG